MAPRRSTELVLISSSVIVFGSGFFDSLTSNLPPGFRDTPAWRTILIAQPIVILHPPRQHGQAAPARCWPARASDAT
jgi:hypothetical protein